MCKYTYIYFPLSTRRCGREGWKEKGKDRTGERRRDRMTVQPKGWDRAIRDNLERRELQPLSNRMLLTGERHRCVSIWVTDELQGQKGLGRNEIVCRLKPLALSWEHLHWMVKLEAGSVSKQQNRTKLTDHQLNILLGFKYRDETRYS